MNKWQAKQKVAVVGLVVFGFAFLVVLVKSVGLGVVNAPQSNIQPATTSPAEEAAAKAQKAAEVAAKAHKDFIDAAEGACMLYTRGHSPLEVKESTINMFEVTTKKPLPQGTAKVGLTYRAGSDGLLMRADCKVLDMGSNVMLDEWKTGPVG